MIELASSEDVDAGAVTSAPVLAELGRMKFWEPQGFADRARALMDRITEEVAGA